MKIEKMTSIHLTETDVRNIIADWLVSHGHNTYPANVTLLVGKRYNADFNSHTRYGDYVEPCFEGCDVVVKGE